MVPFKEKGIKVWYSKAQTTSVGRQARAAESIYNGEPAALNMQRGSRNA